MARSKGGSRFSSSMSCAASRQGNSPSRQRAGMALLILLTIPPPPHPACSRACRPHSSIPVRSPSVHTPSGNPPHSCFLSFRCVQSNGRRAFLPAAFMRSRSPMAGTVTAFRVSRTYSGNPGMSAYSRMFIPCPPLRFPFLFRQAPSRFLPERRPPR